MTIRLLARAYLPDSPFAVTGEIEGDRFRPLFGERSDQVFDKKPRPLTELSITTPVTPTKVVAVALNYRSHAAEMNKQPPEEPLFFLKPPSAIIGPGMAIEIPPDSALVHHEGEMGLVIGKPLKNASIEEAKAGLLGVVCVNDVTARDVQRKQNHYTRGKGYDTFCPIGPFVALGIDPRDLRVQTRVNGQTRQDGRTSDMVFDPFFLVSFISRVMTLQPGDVVATGTPAGVGPIVAGDMVEVEVEGAGILQNPVIEQPVRG